MKTYQHYIGGQYVDPAAASGSKHGSLSRRGVGEDPARLQARDVDRAVDGGQRGDGRGAVVEDDGVGARQADAASSADLVAANADRLAEIEVRDNGKLLAEMRGQLVYHPEWWRYFGGLADKIEGAVVPIDKPDTFAFTRHEPMGVVAALTAWNSPLLFVAWKCAPAIAAGCTVVVKPSEFASASTLEFAALTKEAGFPDGVFNVVTGFGQEAGAALVEHPGVAKITFTGSDATGAKIYAQAARTPEARLARARRQVAEHRVRGLRPGRGRGGRDLRHLRRHRPDLHRGLAAAGAELDPRGVQQAGRGARPHRAQGRSDAGGHQHRSGDDAAAVPQDPRLHRRSPRPRARAASWAAARPRRPACRAGSSSSRRSSPT